VVEEEAVRDAEIEALCQLVERVCRLPDETCGDPECEHGECDLILAIALVRIGTHPADQPAAATAVAPAESGAATSGEE
jgi:hypothetical protein